MINTKRPGTDDYTQVGFLEAKDGQGNYQNIDHIYDSEGNIVFQQGYLNEYDGANDFRIPAIGKPLIDYTIYGNTFQDGIPTPDNPIMPEGTGERTGNLFDWNWLVNGYHLSPQTGLPVSYSTRIANLQPVKISATGAYLSFTKIGTKNIHAMYSVFTDDDTLIRRVTAINSGGYLDLSGGSKLYIAFYDSSTSSAITTANVSNIMLNLGPEALPYEPYGYRIQISSANTTTPVYLGKAETTRRIKKLVLTGNERFINDGPSAGFYRYRVYLTQLCDAGVDDILSSHYPTTKVTNPNSEAIAKPLTVSQFVRFYTLISSLDDFKAYLAAQYSVGTPVTVWFVLATEQTGIVNEPLMKIGDYADTLSMEQAGVEIPTLKRPNTTEIDITTSLPPSEVYAKYRGSKTQKYDLFLAANGDSFEAKNGQSLYIGDDT